MSSYRKTDVTRGYDFKGYDLMILNYDPSLSYVVNFEPLVQSLSPGRRSLLDRTGNKSLRFLFSISCYFLGWSLATLGVGRIIIARIA
jgi:hypothetical protein